MTKGTGHAGGKHGKGRVWKRGLTWWVQYYDHGKQIRESSHSDKKAVAEALLMKRLVGAADGILPQREQPVTYAEMRQRLVIDRLKKGNKSRPNLTLLDESFGGLRASAITEDKINEFIIAQRQLGKANDTVNGYLRTLRRMFNLSHRYVKNPPDFNELKLESSPARQGFINRDQYLRLLAVLPTYVRPIFIFGYYTGMRLGELQKLTWQHVDLTNGIIRLEAEDTKNNEVREIPFGRVPELAELMAQLHQNRASNRVFTRAEGKTLGSFRKAWIRACIKATVVVKTGLSRMVWECPRCHAQLEATEKTWPPERPSCEPPRCASCDHVYRWTYCGMTFHDLRRTGVRNLRRAGVPESIAMKISGHKTRAVFERYNIKDQRDLIEAMEKLAAHQLAEDKRLEPQASRPN